MSEPWGDNSRPDEGCGFCSDFQRMKDDPEVCWDCPHDPDAVMKTVRLTAGLIGNQTLLLASVSADTEAEAVEAAECIQADPEMCSELWRPRA